MMMDLHNQEFLNSRENKVTAHQLVRNIVLVSLLTLPFLFYTYINNMIFDLQRDISEVQKEISTLREGSTGLQVEYSQLLSPQQIEANALAMGFTSANDKAILVLDDSAIRQPSNLYANLVKTKGGWME